jgi:hypothetical protein
MDRKELIMINTENFTIDDWALFDEATRKCHSNVVTFRDVEGEVKAFDENENEIIIDESACTAEFTGLQRVANYQKPRVKEYPEIGEQLDMIFHAGLGGDEFQAAIQAVKNKFPKGG